ncbi:endonuclease III domain-containing protein [Candidatus Omnitrophota bacterium]
MKAIDSSSLRLQEAYRKLYAHFGPQFWWPAQGPFEVVVGAILTQNTAWVNVEKAIAQLKNNKLLTPKKLYRAETRVIARLIRSCGYYNVKAQRVKNFLEVLFSEFQGKLEILFSLSSARLRKRLLAIKGIGPETADSILLYAAGKPSFVVDAYTRRFLLRHSLIGQKADYQQIQALFTGQLPRRMNLFNEYHALIVRLGKDFCRTKPRCGECPLKKWK